MSAYAIFALKFPSLLQFEEEIRKRGKVSNLRSIFGVEQVPSDTRMGEILDEVDPEFLRQVFSVLFRQLQRGNVLKKMRFYKDYYLMSLDGTSYFSSGDIHCERCLQKKRTLTGETLCYFHQMVVGQLVKPGLSEVIPFCPEPVQMQEGKDQNDSERPAVGRFLKNFREDHPPFESDYFSRFTDVKRKASD